MSSIHKLQMYLSDNDKDLLIRGLYNINSLESKELITLLEQSRSILLRD